MKKSTSLFKKVKAIASNGAQPITEGKDNYNLNNPKIEADALRRAEVCKGCENIEEEPIDIFKIADERIPILNNKMCGGKEGCGCALPFLSRQYLKICSKWGEDPKKPKNTSL